MNASNFSPRNSLMWIFISFALVLVVPQAPLGSGSHAGQTMLDVVNSAENSDGGDVRCISNLTTGPPVSPQQDLAPVIMASSSETTFNDKVSFVPYAKEDNNEAQQEETLPWSSVVNAVAAGQQHQQSSLRDVRGAKSLVNGGTNNKALKGL